MRHLTSKPLVLHQQHVQILEAHQPSVLLVEILAATIKSTIAKIPYLSICEDPYDSTKL